MEQKIQRIPIYPFFLSGGCLYVNFATSFELFNNLIRILYSLFYKKYVTKKKRYALGSDRNVQVFLP